MDPDAYETSIDLDDLEVSAEYDYEPEEKAIRYGDNACAGSDARVDLTAVLCKGIDILPLLSAAQRGRIEDEILDSMADDDRAEDEARADAREDR
ncbi:MAG: hypothetical protein IPO00_08740 [Betaproteobacteria bacterium]|nr:hypothetical protein [Betaproteobacteria bacterium]